MSQAKEFSGNIEVLQLVHTTQVRVRYGETDAMGYVYYGNYPLFFEVGRNETMRAHGFPYGRIENEGIMMPVVDMFVHYISPSHYDDLLNITTGILELRGASITFGYLITRERDGARIVWGTTTLAFVDEGTRRPVRASESLRSKLKL